MSDWARDNTVGVGDEQSGLNRHGWGDSGAQQSSGQSENFSANVLLFATILSSSSKMPIFKTSSWCLFSSYFRHHLPVFNPSSTFLTLQTHS